MGREVSLVQDVVKGVNRSRQRHIGGSGVYCEISFIAPTTGVTCSVCS